MKALVISLFLMVFPIAALAHSEAGETVPANGVVLIEAPAEISLSFTDKLRLTLVAASHSSGETQTIDLDQYNAFETKFVLPIQSMGEGTYKVEWRGLGIDGHAMQGTFSFEVE